MRVVEQGGFIVVERENGVAVCEGIPVTVANGERRLTRIEFGDPADQKCNQTRQAAMRALQRAGWR